MNDYSSVALLICRDYHHKCLAIARYDITGHYVPAGLHMTRLSGRNRAKMLEALGYMDSSDAFK
jgi:hypothetical protein